MSSWMRFLCVGVLFFVSCSFFRLSSQFYRPGRTWWDRAVYVSQMQKETEVHQKILDSETTKGAMLTLETISLDSISEKQGWYICWISLTRPRHEMLLVRAWKQWPRKLPVWPSGCCCASWLRRWLWTLHRIRSSWRPLVPFQRQYCNFDRRGDCGKGQGLHPLLRGTASQIWIR